MKKIIVCLITVSAVHAIYEIPETGSLRQDPYVGTSAEYTEPQRSSLSARNPWSKKQLTMEQQEEIQRRRNLKREARLTNQPHNRQGRLNAEPADPTRVEENEPPIQQHSVMQNQPMRQKMYETQTSTSTSATPSTTQVYGRQTSIYNKEPLFNE